MSEAIISLLLLLFAFWLWIWVPAHMAVNRGRFSLVWVLISFLLSPIVAIIGLLILGPTAAHAIWMHEQEMHSDDEDDK